MIFKIIRINIFIIILSASTAQSMFFGLIAAGVNEAAQHNGYLIQGHEVIEFCCSEECCSCQNPVCTVACSMLVGMCLGNFFSNPSHQPISSEASLNMFSKSIKMD